MRAHTHHTHTPAHINNQTQSFIIKVSIQLLCQRDDTTADGFVVPQTGRRRD